MCVYGKKLCLGGASISALQERQIRRCRSSSRSSRLKRVTGDCRGISRGFLNGGGADISNGMRKQILRAPLMKLEGGIRFLFQRRQE